MAILGLQPPPGIATYGSFDIILQRRLPHCNGLRCELSCLMRGDVYQSTDLSSAVDQLVTALDYRIGVEQRIMDLYKMMP